MKLIDQIKYLEPCSQAVEWIGDRSIEKATVSSLWNQAATATEWIK